MKRPFLFATIFLAATLAAFAQQQAGAPGVSMTKFFGGNNKFSADCDLAVTNADHLPLMSGTMKYAMLGDQVRTEIDMAQMQNSQMPPDALQTMQKMGMARAVSITRPDQKSIYLIYPDMKAYAKMPAPSAGQKSTNGTPDVQLTKLGDETIDAHPCVKNQATITGDDGQPHQAVLWNATDLNNFPLQIQSTEQGVTVTMHFKNINLVKPDAGLFEPPAGFTAYDNMQTMMMAAMQKTVKPAPAPASLPQQ